MGRATGVQCDFRLGAEAPCTHTALRPDESTEAFWCPEHWSISQVQRWHRAYHESGHAIAFYIQDLGIDGLSIREVGRTGGEARERIKVYSPLTHCFCLLAGRIADEHATHVHGLNYYDPDNCSSDLIEELKFAKEIVPAQDVAPYLSQLSESVKRMVGERQPEIEALAHLVFHQIDVSGPEAHSVVRGIRTNIEPGWTVDIERRCVHAWGGSMDESSNEIRSLVTSIEDEWRSGDRSMFHCWAIVSQSQFEDLQRVSDVEYHRWISGTVMYKNGAYQFVFGGRPG